jgi:hypothetical protein
MAIGSHPIQLPSAQPSYNNSVSRLSSTQGGRTSKTRDSRTTSRREWLLRGTYRHTRGRQSSLRVEVKVPARALLVTTRLRIRWTPTPDWEEQRARSATSDGNSY